MPAHAVDATVMVAQGSAAITWEVATILAESLSGLGLYARVGRPDTVAVGVPIIVFGQGPVAPPPVSRAQARSAIVILLAGPGTQSFNSATGLAKDAAGCFALSPLTVEALRVHGVRAERLVLGYAERWDTGGTDSRTRPIDIVYPGEVDGSCRGVLARVAVELSDMRSLVDLPAGCFERPATSPAFESSELLADAKLTLGLRRWGDATLDWATTVRAMCNGTLVVAQQMAGYGELVPGEHFLMARTESIGPVIRAAVADPRTVGEMAASAHEFCRTGLAAYASFERLATAIGLSRVPYRIRGRRAGAAARPDTKQILADSQRLTFNLARPFGESPPQDIAHGEALADVDMEVDLICVEHRGAGPISVTRESLRGHQRRLNFHVASISIAARNRDSTPGPGGDSIGASIAEARNDLVRRTNAPLLMFVNSGDEVLADALSCLTATFASSVRPDICTPILALGTDDLAYPWLEGKSQHVSQSRPPRHGYLVRRAYLDHVGPFVGGDGDAAAVDHAFWRRAAAIGGCVAVLPQVGVRLWHETRAS